MKRLPACACALSIFSLASGLVLAESLNIRLTGTIQPSACAVTLTGVDNLDYGTINPADLQLDAYTRLEAKQTNFAVNCPVPTHIAFKAVNGQPGTLAGSTEEESGFGLAPDEAIPESGLAAGLGLQEGSTSKIGGFTLRFGRPVLNGGQGVNIARDEVSDNPRTWRLALHGSMFWHAPTLVTWGVIGAIPARIETLTAPLIVQPYINKAAELNLAEPIPLAGKISIEVVYF